MIYEDRYGMIDNMRYDVIMSRTRYGMLCYDTIWYYMTGCWGCWWWREWLIELSLTTIGIIRTYYYCWYCQTVLNYQQTEVLLTTYHWRCPLSINDSMLVFLNIYKSKCWGAALWLALHRMPDRIPVERTFENSARHVDNNKVGHDPLSPDWTIQIDIQIKHRTEDHRQHRTVVFQMHVAESVHSQQIPEQGG